MGILDRMSTLIRTNVNDMLDRAEDPEKTINQILRDMESCESDDSTDHDWMKASRSALIVAASVVGMPCGNPL